MALFSLSDDWTIELGEDFSRDVEDGALVFVLDDRAVWVDLIEDDRSPEERLALLQGDKPQSAQSWKFTQENLLKFGYVERDEENENYELATISIAAGGFALIIFYFDELESLDWALKSWRSVRFEVVD